MTPGPHRRRSSKESRARRYNPSAVAAPRLLMRSLDCLTQFTTAAYSLTSDRCLAYGYPSRLSGGTAVGR